MRADDCSSALPKAVVKSSSDLITNYRIFNNNSRDIEERFSLVDSHQVEIRQTGCKDFTMEYVFVLGHYATTEKWILDAAYALMREIKLVTYNNINRLLKAIKITIDKGSWKRGEPIEIVKDHEWVVIDVIKAKDNSYSTTLRIRRKIKG